MEDVVKNLSPLVRQFFHVVLKAGSRTGSRILGPFLKCLEGAPNLALPAFTRDFHLLGHFLHGLLGAVNHGPKRHPSFLYHVGGARGRTLQDRAHDEAHQVLNHPCSLLLCKVQEIDVVDRYQLHFRHWRWEEHSSHDFVDADLMQDVLCQLLGLFPLTRVEGIDLHAFQEIQNGLNVVVGQAPAPVLVVDLQVRDLEPVELTPIAQGQNHRHPVDCNLDSVCLQEVLRVPTGRVVHPETFYDEVGK
mmetsp:Transcript_31838/g.51198  ORF Transcript_31838/g.51198 Transcript_31838/m.51198 type:complete len:247 (-) Transcript_31838:193-933(-)